MWISRLKYPFWYFFPGIVTAYFKFKWSLSSKIIIVPHGGLGDIAVIVPILKRLAYRFDEVNVVCNKDYFDTVRFLFNIPDNIRNIHFTDQHRKIYNLSKEFKKNLKKTGTLIALGSYAKDPIINYPDCFFIKLGVNSKHALEQYPFNYNLLHLTNDNILQSVMHSKYCYVNLTTSENIVNYDGKYDDALHISYGNSALALGIIDYIDINTLKPESICESIINNIFVCLRSRKAIISDAGLFNVVIKFSDCPDLIVVTRPHRHSHNHKLYKINFDGTIQSRSAN